MNIEETKEAIRIMQAFVDGKEVQARDVGLERWNAVIIPRWNLEDFEYRIKPTPTIRPWTADEVPLGAWMRTKHNPEGRYLLQWVALQSERDMWLNDREHSTDNGKTWHPCGVMEEAK